MFGAIYVGLSGLNAYSRGLQQVSNNVSNLNTSGFKGSDVSFSNTVGSSTNGGLSLSGTTSAGIGGVELGTLQRDFTQGELRQTQRDLDLAIDGSGFLVLTRGDQTFYTRTGSFEVDKDGYIVLAGTDYRLATLDGSGRAVTLTIDAYRTDPPVKTTTIKFADNLSSTATNDPTTGIAYTVSDVKVYDPLGGQHTWQIQFTKDTSATASPGDWIVKVIDEQGNVVGKVTDSTGVVTNLGTQLLKFNLGEVDPTTSMLTFSDSASGLSVVLDFSSKVTSFSSGSVSTLRAASVDGHGLGNIASVTVNADGELEIGYSNEEKKSLGAIAIADFHDPQELEQRSGGLYVDPGDAGRQLFSTASKEGGRVLSHRLEASNVDLAKQFGDLITIQRGYQASSQIISVANDMIQQLFGIRGQGG
ncbi:MAG TPA: flagellar hook-basal body complex protein [Sphingomicrobium sp.]|nr:flagellar hook-basal body complex protein [Sphingomicrobium sp.]